MQRKEYHPELFGELLIESYLERVEGSKCWNQLGTYHLPYDMESFYRAKLGLYKKASIGDEKLNRRYHDLSNQKELSEAAIDRWMQVYRLYKRIGAYNLPRPWDSFYDRHEIFTMRMLVRDQPEAREGDYFVYFGQHQPENFFPPTYLDPDDYQQRGIEFARIWDRSPDHYDQHFDYYHSSFYDAHCTTPQGYGIR